MFHSDINPNTLISILATLNRSSLLLYVTQGIAQSKWPYFQRKEHRLSDLQAFDDASRGPLGSLCLLWSINIKVSPISTRPHGKVLTTMQAVSACFGAIVVMLALLMEPFTQQIIVPYSKDTATTESASIPTTIIYTAEYTCEYLPGPSWTTDDPTPTDSHRCS